MGTTREFEAAQLMSFSFKFHSSLILSFNPLSPFSPPWKRSFQIVVYHIFDHDRHHQEAD